MAKRSRLKPAAPASSAVRAYLAALPPAPRRSAKAIRALIRAAVPEAVEHFSYGVPGFRFNGKPLAWYGGWTEHISIYPFSEAFARAHGIPLKGYETSKGTIRFPLSKPLPTALIKRLIKARMNDLRMGM
jgi:uncharacterized protein YdhG (YjbR/CyaY superfamily)